MKRFLEMKDQRRSGKEKMHLGTVILTRENKLRGRSEEMAGN